MAAAPHPHVPWVSCNQIQPGIFVCQCTLCGAQTPPSYAQGADQFASVHAGHQQTQAPTHYGAGDLVAKATGALGIKPCAPCKKRQAQLNGLLPRVWKR